MIDPPSLKTIRSTTAGECGDLCGRLANAGSFVDGLAMGIFVDGFLDAGLTSLRSLLHGIHGS